MTKSKMSVKESVRPLKDENNEIVSDDKKMATIFSEYFSTVFTKESLLNVTDPRQIFNGDYLLEEVDLSTKAVLK